MFIFKQILELPFMLSIPSAIYPIKMNDTVYKLDIRNDSYCVSMQGSDSPVIFFVGSKKDAEYFIQASNNKSLALIKNRTTITLTKHNNTNNYLTPNNEDINNEISAQYRISGTEPEIENKINEIFKFNTRDKVHNFLDNLSKKMTSRKLFSPVEGYEFISIINKMLRLYIVSFNDIFASEISQHELSSTNLGGVLYISQHNDDVIDINTLIGKLPTITKTNYFIHQDEPLEKFKHAISTGKEVDASLLLISRAKNLLEKSAYRSSIIEASAALENYIAIKLIDRLTLKLGSTDEVKKYLRKNENQRFDYRCKVIFKELYGLSIAENDPKLWERVIASRKNFRHKVTHSSLEPAESDAREAVNCYFDLITNTQRKLEELKLTNNQ